MNCFKRIQIKKNLFFVCVCVCEGEGGGGWLELVIFFTKNLNKKIFFFLQRGEETSGCENPNLNEKKFFFFCLFFFFFGGGGD